MASRTPRGRGATQTPGGGACPPGTTPRQSTTPQSRLSSAPKHPVAVKPRRNPKEVREAALAKKLAAIKAKEDARNAPEAGSAKKPKKVKTTVAKTTSVPGGGEETVTVQQEVTEGAQTEEQATPAPRRADFKPRYNRLKEIHPDDELIARNLEYFIPKKPAEKCFKVERGKRYEESQIRLWEKWQKYKEHQEKIKCWKQNRPYVSQREKEDRAFRRWFQKEEERAEMLYKAGKLKIMPPSMRPPSPVKKQGRKVVSEKSPPRKNLPKAANGKKRYALKDASGVYIRYNSLNVAHMDDVYKAAGLRPPPYVQPPLKEDGTFKDFKDRTEQERLDFAKYRIWEDYYWKLQAWENDQLIPGDPEVLKAIFGKPEAKGGRDKDAERKTMQDRVRELKEAKKKAKEEAAKKAEKEKKKKLLAGTKSKAARAAILALHKAEEEEKAKEAAKQAELADRAKRFLKRGSRQTTPLGRGRVDLSRVQSSIGREIRQRRLAMRAAEAAANAPRPPTPEPMRTPPPAPPMEGMLEAEMRRQHDLMQTVTKQRYDSLMPRMSDIMVRTGRTCPIRIYRGEPVEHHPGQVTMLEYDQSLPVSCLFGSPEPPPVATCQSPPPVCSGSPDDPEVPIRRFGRVPHIAQPPSPPVSHLQGPERYALTYDTERIRRTAGGAGEHFDQVPEMPLLDEFDPQDDQEYWTRAVDDWMNQPFRERRQRMEEERARMTCRTPPEVHPVMSRKQLRRRLEGYRPPQMELPDDPRLPPVHRQRVVPYHEVQPARSPTPPPRTPSPPRPVHVPCDELVDLRTPPRGPQSPETPERQSPWTPLFTPRKEGPTQEEILERRKEVMGRVEKACQPGKQFPSRMGDIEEARWRCERANVELPRRPLTPESPGPGLWDPCDQMFMERQLQRQLEAMSSGSEPSPRQPSPRQPSPRRPSPRQPSCPEPASDFALPRFQLGPQARHLLDEMGCLPLEDYGC